MSAPRKIEKLCDKLEACTMLKSLYVIDSHSVDPRHNIALKSIFCGM